MSEIKTREQLLSDIAYDGIIVLNNIRQSRMGKAAIIAYAEREYQKLLKAENNLPDKEIEEMK